MARDACHYRRGQLEPSAIRNLMMLRHHDMKELEKEVFSQEDQQPNESSFDRTKVQADIQAAFEEEFISSDEELDDDELYDQELFQSTQQSQRGRNAQPNARSTRFQRNENSQIGLRHPDRNRVFLEGEESLEILRTSLPGSQVAERSRSLGMQPPDRPRGMSRVPETPESGLRRSPRKRAADLLERSSKRPSTTL
ncbi:MAG: hypothetical protein M1816_005585 [Peltula sp. TS41687]|nr:MAG: hypothetical protein M1816_005585 [Peltula sp. TS41687]